MDSTFKKLTTKEKALTLNLNEKIYGTLAEIGAGQEVAMNFFKAGAASGTIAKTMSAYDMTFSDAIYGESERYVCQDKLYKMLDKEYNLLSDRLHIRGKRTNFFAFANTVEALNYKKTNSGHAWIGLRFQLHPNTAPNDCIIHVVLKDNDALWQQEVLGKVGVNLIYGCYNFTDPEELIESLIDNFSKDRIEIDMFRLKGPDFHHVDNRLMSLLLVKLGLTQATMFDQTGKVQQPSEALYKKNILVLRGRFRPVTYVTVDMFLTSLKHFKKYTQAEKDKVVVLAELTLNDLSSDGEIDEADFLDRVDLLCSLGQTVLISNYPEHYKLSSYLNQFSRGSDVAFILGINNLARLFEESYYENLKGGILEAFGKLFLGNVKLLVYPSLMENGDKLNICKNFKPSEKLQHLYDHLYKNNFIEDIPNARVENLKIISDDVLALIRKGDTGWEQFVPHKVADTIKKQCMFDYPCKVKEEPNPID
ncbi:MAG: TonB-dependent receptor [Cyclobacteriaceae bacterium]